MKNKFIICIIIAVTFFISSGCELMEFFCYAATEFHKSCEQKGIADGPEMDIIRTAESKGGLTLLGIQAVGNIGLAAVGKDTKKWNNMCNTSRNTYLKAKTGDDKVDYYVMTGSIVDGFIYNKLIKNSGETKRKYEENIQKYPEYECYYRLERDTAAKGYKLQDGDVYWKIVHNDSRDIDNCLKRKREFTNSIGNEYISHGANNGESTTNENIDKTSESKPNESSNLNSNIATDSKFAEEKKKQDAMNALASTKVEKFKFNDTNLTEEQKQELDNAADILNRYSDVKICITGHTCSLGTESVNERVGMKRAEAGKEYLVGKGVSSDRIILESKGETEPIAPNTKDSISQNRRIEIKVIK